MLVTISVLVLAVGILYIENQKNTIHVDLLQTHNDKLFKELEEAIEEKAWFKELADYCNEHGEFPHIEQTPPFQEA